MKNLFQFLYVFNVYFLIAKSQILNWDDTFSPDNEMPRNYRGSTFINTDGIQQFCYTHANCYSMREPIHWCHLFENQQWTEKGCYCDPILKSCIIERITKLGPVSKINNYAYCIPRNSWQCPPYQFT